MVVQVRDFLSLLEQLGLANSAARERAREWAPIGSEHSTVAILRDIAGQLGYRLLPELHYPAY